MKKLSRLTLCAVFIFLSACNGMSISSKMYSEICDYVEENKEYFSPESGQEFYEYTSDGISIGGVYYGYYYSESNEFILPDFYFGNDIEKIKNDVSEADDGVYFGTPNKGTDWCFVKKICDYWFYYELHWS